MLTTLLQPDAGRAIVAGHDVVAQPQAVRRASACPASSPRSTRTSPAARTSSWSAGSTRCSAEAGKRAAELLEQFDLADAADRPAKTYSGGMRRRLDLAGSLVVHRRVMFLDEPTTGLDPRSRLSMWDVIRERVRAARRCCSPPSTSRRPTARRHDRRRRPRHGHRRRHRRPAQGPGGRRARRGRRARARPMLPAAERVLAAAATVSASVDDTHAPPHRTGEPAARSCSPRSSAISTTAASRSTTSGCAARRSTTCSSTLTGQPRGERTSDQTAADSGGLRPGGPVTTTELKPHARRR